MSLPEGDALSTYSVLQGPQNAQQQKEHDAIRAIQRIYRTFLRGFAIAFSLRGGLHAVTTLAHLIRGRRPIEDKSKIVDTLKWACSLGCFGGVFVGVDEAIRGIVGSNRSATWRAALAGALAGPCILLSGPRARHDEFALYCLLRGITLLVRCGNKALPGSLLHRLLTPTRWQNGDTALMCLSTWQILFSYVMRPSTLPLGYIKFLNRMAGLQSWIVPVAREIALKNAGRPPHSHAVLRQALTKAASATPDLCALLHPHHAGDCNGHFRSMLRPLFQQSFMVYLPLYVASSLTVHRDHFLRRPMQLLPRLVLGACRSALFLSAFVALCHRGLCMANTTTFLGAMTPGITPTKIAAFTWMPGMTTLLEKKSRRMELALYCTCRAILSLYQAIFQGAARSSDAHRRSRSWLQLLTVRMDVLTFSAAAAAIMHCYSDAYGQHRDIFRSKYINVLDFMFGGDGLKTGAIKHASSNRTLLMRASTATRDKLRSTISSRNLLRLHGTVDEEVAK